MLLNKKTLKIAVGTIVASKSVAIAGSLGCSSSFFSDTYDVTAKVLGKIETFASKGMGYSYSLWFFRDIKNYAIDFYDWLKHKIIKTTFRKPEEVEKLLEKGFSKIKGQERAKEEVMDFALKVSNEKNEAEMNKKARKVADVILLTGTSGCGKSMMAKELASAISTAPAFVISSGDIDTNNKYSIVSQLFGQRQSTVGYGHDYQKPNEKNCLISYIERVKHGVIIIEEYDKMHCKSLDEVLRAFSDNGAANVCGQKVDASNITFILTSNESRESVNCKLEKPKAVNASGENKGVKNDQNEGNDIAQTNNDNAPIDAQSINNISAENSSDVSRTNIWHDKSFMNRLTIVEFDDLTEKDYEEIVESEYGKSMPKYWKSYANITLDISKVFRPVARKAMKMDEHGRAPRKIMSKLTGILSRRSHELRGKKVLVKYNEKENEFSLKTT